MRILTGLAVLFAISPVAAEAQEICGALDEIIESSQKEFPFFDVQEAIDRGELPMLWDRRGSCHVTPGEEVGCYMIQGSGGVAAWDEIGDCPGVVETEPEPEQDRWGRGVYMTAYRVAGLRIEYGTHCASCRVIPYGFSITFDER